ASADIRDIELPIQNSEEPKRMTNIALNPKRRKGVVAKSNCETTPLVFRNYTTGY
ncbi:hypothetical protein C5S29_06355, partial [ANME-1 cluster archaeon GoMg3.2]|nr:hypothetical protein [ANME-1 cluster archaeon GoMg3.2]